MKTKFNFENGNLVMNFEKLAMTYSKYLKVEDIKNSASYYICPLEGGLFDIYYIDGECYEEIEVDCIKITDTAGLARLFVRDTESKKFFIAFSGYDFSYFSNAMLLNLEETKEVCLVIFNEDTILVEEVGKLKEHNQDGITIDDHRWVPYKKFPQELDHQDRPVAKEMPKKKSFFDSIKERFFVAFL